MADDRDATGAGDAEAGDTEAGDRGAGDRGGDDRPALTHVDETGAARMVDVSDKAVTAREATAAGTVRTTPEVVALLRDQGLAKGDAVSVARLAGIMGVKRTPDLIPLCHPLEVTGTEAELELGDSTVEITVTVRTTGRTGVEMEALTGVTTAALTVVDMIKAVDREAVITDVRVLAKSGGRSGDWTRPDAGPAGTGTERGS